MKLSSIVNSPGRVLWTLLLLLVCSRVIMTFVAMRARVEAANPKMVSLSPYPAADAWTVWDFEHYHWIAKYGYPDNDPAFEQPLKAQLRAVFPFSAEPPPQQRTVDYMKEYSVFAFMPAYPYLVRAVSWLGGDMVLCGLVISNAALLLAAYLLFLLMKMDFERDAAFYASVFLILNPFTCMLSSFSAEAIFVCLFMAGLVAARRGMTGASFGCAALLSIVHPFGVFMSEVFLIAAIRNRTVSLRSWAGPLIMCAASTLPLVLHIGWLYLLTGDPLVKMNALRPWNRTFGMSGPLRTFQIATIVPERMFELYLWLGALVAAGLVLAFVRTREGRRIPPELAFWCIMVLILPVLSGSLLAFPRHMLTLVPIWIGAGCVLARMGRASPAAAGIVLGLSFLASCAVVSVWTQWSYYFF